jgi:LysM repeat protein
MAIRRPARLVAPLVLLLCAAAVLLIVQRTLNEDAGSPATATTPTPEARTTTTRAPRTYRVRSGDTMGSIAERYDLSVDELLQLNPDVDPQTLRAGQRLRLRE